MSISGIYVTYLRRFLKYVIFLKALQYLLQVFRLEWLVLLLGLCVLYEGYSESRTGSLARSSPLPRPRRPSARTSHPAAMEVSTELLNKVLHVLWPHLSRYVRKYVTQLKESASSQDASSIFNLLNICIEDVELGATPPNISNIALNCMAHMVAEVEADLRYEGDATITVSGLPMNIANLKFDNINLHGRVRVKVTLVSGQHPRVADVSVSLPFTPNIQFSLTGWLADVIHGSIQDWIMSLVEKNLVEPQQLCVSLLCIKKSHHDNTQQENTTTPPMPFVLPQVD